MAAQKATDEKNSLGQAYLKYMDALALDEAKIILFIIICFPLNANTS
jgi:hypothetical protein